MTDRNVQAPAAAKKSFRLVDMTTVCTIGALLAFWVFLQ